MALGAAPLGGRLEQAVGHGLIVDGLEEAEEADAVAVGLVVQAIADGGDAADDFAVAFGQEVLGLGVLEEGVLLAGEKQLHVPTQRRDPERVPRVEPVGQVDEAFEVSSVARRADAQPFGQMTPRSRPIRPNCSSAEVDLLEGVRRHDAGTEPALGRLHRGRRNRIGEDSGVEQPAPHQERLLQGADQHRHDRRLGRADLEAQAPEAGLQAARVGPETVAPLGLVLQHLQRGQHASRVGGRQRRGEDQRPAVMLEIVDHVLGRGDEPADRGQRLREGAGDDVDVIGHAEVGGSAVAVRSENAEGVRVVERERGPVFPGHPHERRHVRDVAFHRVHAVHHDHRALARAVPLHAALEVGEVAMVEALGFAVGHLGPVDDRGMVELVQIDHFAAADEPGDEAEVGRVAGGEDQTGFLAQEFGQRVLELLVEVQRPVQEPAARTARAVPAERPAGGFEHLRMVSQAEVVVGPQHDPFLAVDDDDGVLRFGNRIEVRIEANGLQLTGFGEFAALVEERDLLKLLSIHGASARSGGEEKASHRFATEWLKLVNARG